MRGLYILQHMRTAAYEGAIHTAAYEGAIHTAAYEDCRI